MFIISDQNEITAPLYALWSVDSESRKCVKWYQICSSKI